MNHISSEKHNILYAFLLIIPYAAIALLPGEYSSVFRLSTPLGDLRADFIAFTLCLFLIFALSLNGINITSLKELKYIIFATCAFYAANIISMIINQLAFDTFRYTFFIFVFSLGTILLVGLARTKVNIRKTIKYIVIVSTIVCIVGLLEFFNISRIYTPLFLADNASFSYFEGSSTNRIASSIGNPLVLSGFLLMSLPFVFFMKETSQAKMKWNIVLAIHFFTLLLTQSRSAYIVLAILLIYYYSVSIKKIFITIISLTVVSSIFLMILNAFDSSSSFIERLLFKTQGESLSIRLEAFPLALKMIQESHYLLFGLGPNKVNVALEPFISTVDTLDNVFLNTIVSTGLIGFITFMMLFIIPWIMFGKMDTLLKKTGRAIILAIIAMGFSFNVTYFTPIWGVYWLGVTLLIMYNLNMKKGYINTTKTSQ